MNKNITNYQNPLSKSQVVKTLKLLIFGIGKLNLAISINSVRKVINYTPVHGSGLSSFGMIHLEDQEITVLDLHKRLFHESLEVVTGKKGYLILVKNSAGESFAIWVGETPTLVDISLNQIRELPESYRTNDTLEIASHVTVIKQNQESLTVFLLDPDRLIPLTSKNH